MNEKNFTLDKVVAQLPSTGPQRFLNSLPSDPLFTANSQWHLGFIGSLGFVKSHTASNSLGLAKVWVDYQGDGISVGIWDDGVQSNHWDLLNNYDSLKHVTVSGSLNNGQPMTSSDGHGTSVAGLIAADNNGLGGVGIAYDAKVTAIRIFGGADDINTNWLRYLQTLNSLKNFDVTNHSYGGYPDFYLWDDVTKFEVSVEEGRGTLGTVNVKSAGNDNVDGNGDALDASRFTVTVAAIGNNSTGNIASYSTYGSHVLISAPAGSVTTDLSGIGTGYDGLLNGDYTNQFGGTSAAGPITAGVISLMLDANSGLGWRDVNNILAYSAIATGSFYSGIRTNENFIWKWNGADNWNGGGLHFSEDYGYGMVNAYNAVRMAEVWSLFDTTAATSSNELSVSTGTLIANRTIADRSTLNYSFSVTQSINLEHVALTISLNHSYFTDLRISLISPSGTVMSVCDGSTGDGRTSDFGLTYTFGIEGYRGENTLGTWTLRIQDAVRSDSGILNSVSFTGFGKVFEVDDVYHYTDEIFEVLNLLGQSERLILEDTNGGVDWINAAAITKNLEINLIAGETSLAGGMSFLRLANDSFIENAIGGDGDDQIEGNGLDNLIFGMRGNDTLIGGGGSDIAGFYGNYEEFVITANNGVTTVVGTHGTDTLVGFEILRFTDRDVVDPSAGIVISDITSPILVSSNPIDNAIDVAIDADLVLTFNEPVQAGNGLISVYKESGLLFESINVTSGAVVFDDRIVTVSLSTSLSKDESYYVLIEADTIKDTAGNSFAQISSPSILNFTTLRSLNLITGTNQNDRLIGSDGVDLIEGLAGSDILNGKLGADTLVGGSGKDNFVFDTSLGVNNIDVIQSFSVRDDTIQLENAIFSSLARTGTLGTSFLRANESGVAVDADDFIVFNTLNGNVYYDSDGNGVGVAVHFLTLIDIVGTVTRADFVVI